MIKKLLPAVVLALCLMAPASYADNDNSLLNKGMWSGVVAPEMLGLKIYPDLKDEAVSIETAWPTTVNVTAVDVRDKHLDQTVLTYSADLKSERLAGTGYLEMWVHIPGGGGGTFPIRGLTRPLQGSMPWSRYEASFALAKGQVPDIITLNLVINGKGTVWLRNVKLTHNP